jgi:hypothetical protein
LPNRHGHDKFRGAVAAERLIAPYIEPNSDRAAVLRELIILFGGPQQREAEKLGAEALD